jgi:hypothetical protein
MVLVGEVLLGLERLMEVVPIKMLLRGLVLEVGAEAVLVREQAVLEHRVLLLLRSFINESTYCT